MENEYNAEVVMTPMGKDCALDLTLRTLTNACHRRNILAKDRLTNQSSSLKMTALRWFADKYPDVTLEREDEQAQKMTILNRSSFDASPYLVAS